MYELSGRGCRSTRTSVLFLSIKISPLFIVDCALPSAGWIDARKRCSHCRSSRTSVFEALVRERPCYPTRFFFFFLHPPLFFIFFSFFPASALSRDYLPRLQRDCSGERTNVIGNDPRAFACRSRAGTVRRLRSRTRQGVHHGVLPEPAQTSVLRPEVSRLSYERLVSNRCRGAQPDQHPPVGYFYFSLAPPCGIELITRRRGR